MFPSSGYFRGVSCPYFLLGYCDRPHCHFRHVKPPEKEQPAPQQQQYNIPGFAATSNPSVHPSQASILNMMGNFIKLAQNNMAEPSSSAAPAPSAASYNPTPIKEPELPEPPATKPTYGKHHTPSSLIYQVPKNIPQYNPTPIRLLKKTDASNGKAKPGTIPYDPNSNFSVIGVGGERVTLGESTKRKHEEEEGSEPEEATASKKVKPDESCVKQLEEEKEEKEEEKTDGDKPKIETTADKEEEKTTKENENVEKKEENIFDNMKKYEDKKKADKTEGKVTEQKTEEKTSKDKSKHHKHHKHHRKESTSSSSRKKSSHHSSSHSSSHHSKSSSSSSSHIKKSSHSSSSSKSKDHKSSQSSSSKSSKKHEIQRSTSNVELFGDDSDEERKMKAAKKKADSDSDELLLSSDSDTDLMQACDAARAEEVVVSEMSVGKKRVAHASTAEISDRRIQLPSRRAGPTPSQVMINRMREMQRRSSVSSQDTNMARRLGQNQQKKTFLDSSSGHSSDLSLCLNKRVAHVPKVKVIKRPIVVATSNSKVPTNVRQRYLNVFCDQCVTIYPEEEDAYEKAVSMEQDVYQRSLNRNGYLNKAAMAVKRLRDEAAVPPHRSPPMKEWKKKPSLSHEAILGGKKAADANFTVKRSHSNTSCVKEVKGVEFYHRLEKYILTTDQLKENGYPAFIPDEPGMVSMKKSDRATKNHLPNANERLCTRCGKRFMVFADGKYERQEECCYHWGKSFKRRIAGSLENRFTCCGQDPGAKGCELAKVHVHEINRYSDVHGYVRTLPCDGMDDEDPGVYALDCEMVYTTAGLELARVTVIDQNLDVLLEKVVKPESTVIDCNTRFSGMTDDNLRGETTSLKDVQAILLSLFTEKTILMGHSLESDFLALKLVHPTVVDTSVVFPHRMGPPYKRALRNLCSDILMKIIQDNGDEGHDSREDAAACMDLMIWKIKEDMKHRKR